VACRLKLAARGLSLAACSLKLAARSLRLGALDKPFRVIRVEPRGIHAKIIGYEFLLTHTSLRSSHLDPGCPDSTIAHGRFPTSQLPVP